MDFCIHFVQCLFSPLWISQALTLVASTVEFDSRTYYGDVNPLQLLIDVYSTCSGQCCAYRYVWALVAAAAVLCGSGLMVCVTFRLYKLLHPAPLTGFVWKKPLFGLLKLLFRNHKFNIGSFTY